MPEEPSVAEAELGDPVGLLFIEVGEPVTGPAEARLLDAEVGATFALLLAEFF